MAPRKTVRHKQPNPEMAQEGVRRQRRKSGARGRGRVAAGTGQRKVSVHAGSWRAREEARKRRGAAGRRRRAAAAGRGGMESPRTGPRSAPCSAKRQCAWSLFAVPLLSSSSRPLAPPPKSVCRHAAPSAYSWRRAIEKCRAEDERFGGRFHNDSKIAKSSPRACAAESVFGVEPTAGVALAEARAARRGSCLRNAVYARDAVPRKPVVARSSTPFRLPR